jgi:uncharacterized protein (TIGR00369 family)
MDNEKHYRALEKMYLSAPINEIYKPCIRVSHESAEIEIEVNEKLFHAARAVHGSVYFKMLDDAAYFAANSIEKDCFVLTVSFTTYLTRPISGGRMKSVGKVINKTKKQIIAEAFVYDGEEREIGRGSGIFVRGKVPLVDTMGYGDEL